METNIMQILMSIFNFFWFLSVPIIIIVLFHEFGHYIVGRLCGVKVDVFSLGCGPELFGFQDRYGTRWRLAALPFGGYVKFHGDTNDVTTTDSEAVSAMPANEQTVIFLAQKAWKRAAIVIAGPFANFFIAFSIFIGYYFYQNISILQSLQFAFDDIWFIFSNIIYFIKGSMIGNETFEQLIKVAHYNFMNLLYISAVLSIVTGVVNLFPFPSLDGGYLSYYIIEAISGYKIYNNKIIKFVEKNSYILFIFIIVYCLIYNFIS